MFDAALFDKTAAKDFLATGKNPYEGNEEAIAKGKKAVSYTHLDVYKRQIQHSS